MTIDAVPKKTWFGKEPVWLVNTVTTAVVAVVALSPWPEVLEAAVAAVAVAGGGLLIAATVVRRGALAALLGLVRAFITVLVLTGWDIDPSQQALILVAIEAVASIFLSTQVTAPISPDGTARGANDRAPQSGVTGVA
ncbi:MAG TPA: hypothetical protein VGW74_20225 [Propionibacteriaceae bacterium]|nr:hypothetical protein [Propionibacteriaceae bacterium]